MKRFLSTIMILTLVTALFVGCSGDDTVTINVFNWGDYIDPSVIEMFTEETGIQVNYETFDSNEAMRAKLLSGGIDYDVLFPSDYMIETLLNDDKLLPLNFDNIPNYKYIDPNFKDLPYDSTNTYSVPYMWGTVGILYNTDMVTEEVKSWDILWDEKYSGQILMQDSVRDTYAVALKRLGYSLNAADKGQVEEATQMLMDQKPMVQAYVIDQVKDKMIGNEAALAVIYSGEVWIVSDENDAVAYTVPDEGSNLWTDAMVIPNTSKNQEAAEVFINFMCKPEIAFMNTDYIGYSTPHTEAYHMLDDEVKNDPSAYPPQEILDNCEVYVDLGSEMNQFYADEWNKLKAY